MTITGNLANGVNRYYLDYALLTTSSSFNLDDEGEIPSSTRGNGASTDSSKPPQQQQRIIGQLPPASPVAPMESGWDDSAIALYRDMVTSLHETARTKGTLSGIRLPSAPASIIVSHETINNGAFWQNAQNHGWERSTFDIFRRYVIPNKTIVIDFGTWIGPTLLYHSQFSMKSYGIEADPAAFAVVEYNVALNRQQEQEEHRQQQQQRVSTTTTTATTGVTMMAATTSNDRWADQIVVQPGCVSSPQHVGQTTMKAAGGAGQSMSSLTKVYLEEAHASRNATMVRWQVRCNTLSTIMEQHWGLSLLSDDYNIMLKVDVESYECHLLPSWYDWLESVPDQHLPTIFVSLHPQIADCSEEQWDGIYRLMALYGRQNGILRSGKGGDLVYLAPRDDQPPNDMTTMTADAFKRMRTGGPGKKNRRTKNAFGTTLVFVGGASVA